MIYLLPPTQHTYTFPVNVKEKEPGHVPVSGSPEVFQLNASCSEVLSFFFFFYFANSSSTSHIAVKFICLCLLNLDVDSISLRMTAIICQFIDGISLMMTNVSMSLTLVIYQQSLRSGK